MENRNPSADLCLSDIPENGRLCLHFSGIVQGVGFRPFLYRAAQKFKLHGFVKNTGGGVTLEVEGKHLPQFVHYIVAKAPPLSRIDTLRWESAQVQGSTTFVIKESERQGKKNALVSPDIALCTNCQHEMDDAADRRYDYPFTNCTDCGPRFTLIEDLPYDRPLTTMKGFMMWPQCQSEYENPLDRRYHAQPVSCPQCGPRLHLYIKGKVAQGDPLAAAVKALLTGKVLAVKGVGGFHLACLASDLAAVNRLRTFKKRARKPFALMATLEMIRSYCHMSKQEKALLSSPAAPIVLLNVLAKNTLIPLVAPGQRRLGFMLPYSPLHRLLIAQINGPLVMTSANRSDEPIIFQETAQELPTLCDAMLAHDRPIHSFADDSVAMIFDKAPYFIRRSRGYVPLPIDLPFTSSRTILALGGLLKSTFTLIHGHRAFVGQHIGDTETNSALLAEKGAIDHFLQLFSHQPEVIVVDGHPAYPNRLLAAEFPAAKVVEIQHHQAHIASLLAESGEKGPVIGIALDGTGYGDDGTIWGGEFFVGGLMGLERKGHLRPVFLPGGDTAAREPWRMALSLLKAIPGQEEATRQYASRFGRQGEQVLEAITWRRGGIMTSSCGRLFDGVAALLGLGDFNSYEGELPGLLQTEAETARAQLQPYPFTIEYNDGMPMLNLLPAIAAMLADKKSRPLKARRFHQTLAHALLDMTVKLSGAAGIKKVALSGGVFQNTLLLKMSRDLLQNNGFQVLYHRQVPANDGGISLGQAALAAFSYRKES